MQTRSLLENSAIFGKSGTVQFFNFRRLFWTLILAVGLCLISRQNSPKVGTVSKTPEISAGPTVRPRSTLSAQEVRHANPEELKAQSLDICAASDFFAERQVFGDFVDSEGRCRRFRAGCVVVQWKDQTRPTVVATRMGEELETLRLLARRHEIAFAELDILHERQSLQLNDPQATNQWHHAVIGTTNAWRVSPGNKSVRIGIIDYPFQMDHIDLAANVVPGWDVQRNQPITNPSAPDWHSTRGAGLAAAVAGNNIGVAGVSQCAVLPISGTNYTTTFMYNAIVWAADHNVRVVNASWDIANSALINSAGQYLRDTIQGILIVPGENPRKYLSTYVNHPYIFAVSMTDEFDEDISSYGDHIDIAAPGWNVYSTSTNNTYEYDTGTSYSAPIVAGAAAALLTINPTFTTDQLMAMLRFTAKDLGPPGWDVFYGQGRLDFHMAAIGAFSTLPVSRLKQGAPDTVSLPMHLGAQFVLGRANDPFGPWNHIPAFIFTNENRVFFQDQNPLSINFYRVEVTLP